jgi:threonine dehydrogenase-like Zn-dependent dehydrogenase
MFENNCMKTSVILSPGNIEIQETPIPIPGDNQILVKLEGCGVCSSNLPLWEGRPWFNYPLEPGQGGHEGWGHIVDKGKYVNQFNIGDCVTFISNHAYAEYDVCRFDEAVILPDELYGIPFPGEPLGCAMNIFDRCDIHADQTVAIIGIGFLGALLTQLASKRGAKVIAVSKRESSLKTAKDSGAAEIIPMNDHWQIIENVKNITDGKFCDCVIEATGKQWPLDLAGELSKIRGRIIVAGYHQDGPRQVNMQLWNWRGLDVINAHERDTYIYIKGIENAVEAVTQGRINPFPLLTNKFSLSGLSSAFELLTDRPDNFVKSLIIYEDNSNQK